jgi:hypothetical protein
MYVFYVRSTVIITEFLRDYIVDLLYNFLTAPLILKKGESAERNAAENSPDIVTDKRNFFIGTSKIYYLILLISVWKPLPG